MQGTVTVRDWQTDSAHDTKPHPLRGDTQPTPWSVKYGIDVQPGRGHTTAWAVRMVLSCQQARATEAC